MQLLFPGSDVRHSQDKFSKNARGLALLVSYVFQHFDLVKNDLAAIDGEQSLCHPGFQMPVYVFTGQSGKLAKIALRELLSQAHVAFGVLVSPFSAQP